MNDTPPSAPTDTDAAPEPGEARVSGHTLAHVPGRFLLSARTNHLVTDSRFGPGESIQAGELLLAALTSCAMANIQSNAAAEDLPLTDIDVRAEHRRGSTDVTRYDYTTVYVHLTGVDQPTAESLTTRFTETCPIYNTVRRGSGIELVVTSEVMNSAQRTR
ncbi:OsmC family protein [Nocardia callitridis]|uniref:OsmC family peroxiredoxin n=1 Tax=Nocardia callitridis TaxID=648753 RepID=A0ABP9KP78_9NOCA